MAHQNSGPGWRIGKIGWRDKWEEATRGPLVLWGDRVDELTAEVTFEMGKLCGLKANAAGVKHLRFVVVGTVRPERVAAFETGVLMTLAPSCSLTFQYPDGD